MDAATLFSLAGRRALVTGASGGLGLHFAEVLHAAGAEVVLAARRVAQIEHAATRLGPRARAVAMDVADEASIVAGFAAIDAGGVCDIVVNNAGVAPVKRALDISGPEWDAVMDVNLRGAFLVARTAAERLVAAGRPGSIVNIASIVGSRVTLGVAAYNASKAGLVHLTRALAVEWARHGIRVNALAPGYFETDINSAYFATEQGKAMIQRIPQRRLGRLDDLTGPLLLLASEAGAHMTGSVVTVDGGHSVNPL